MKSTIQILMFTAGICLCLSGLAQSATKSVILGFHQRPGPSEQALIHGARGIIKKTFQLIPAMVVNLPEEEIANMKKDSKVAYIEEDAMFSAVQPIQGDEYASSWGVWHIFADVAHISGNRGGGVRIAVMDTGIDYTHPELAGNYKGGYDFVFNDEDPFDDNSESHGTHVAGIIAAEENGTGVIGVAPDADIYAVKVLDGGGFGLLSWLVSGIEWSVNNDMDIINLSLEGEDFQSLKDACEEAYNAGVLLIAAAGNLGSSIRFPAAYDSVVAVTATDMSDNKVFRPAGLEAELAAPGIDILSTVAVTEGSYGVISGTSQATPHVTGTAALFFASVGDLNNDGMINNIDVRHALRITATDLGEMGRDDNYGYGLVNATEASLPSEVSFTIIKDSSPIYASETIHLAGVPYEVKIVNDGLAIVNVDVYEGDNLMKDLSSSYLFSIKNPQEASFILDATGKRYDVIFTPLGRSGSSADITITLK